MDTGTDHASIATEVKIINALKEEGIEKEDLEERSSQNVLGIGKKNMVDDHRTDEETWIFL